jgi:DNA polymerase elongation subunit (family B)
MVFIDIETVPKARDFDKFQHEVPEQEEYWRLKYYNIKDAQPYSYNDVSSPYTMWEYAGLYPEFGKIVSISIGQIKFNNDDEPTHIKTKSFYSEDENDEYKLLESFFLMCRKIMEAYPNIQWVGHNIRGFDIPYIIKRGIINGFHIPEVFHVQKKKPWETQLLDTQDIWKFNGYSTAKLDLIASVLNIPSSEAEQMESHHVGRKYWHDGRVDEIAQKSEADVEKVANVMLALSNLDRVKKVSN